MKLSSETAVHWRGGWMSQSKFSYLAKRVIQFFFIEMMVQFVLLYKTNEETKPELNQITFLFKAEDLFLAIQKYRI